jgi:hypothetical protein
MPGGSGFSDICKVVPLARAPLSTRWPDAFTTVAPLKAGSRASVKLSVNRDGDCATVLPTGGEA